MIRPTKYMRLEQCLLRVVALLLESFMTVPALPVSEINGFVAESLGEAATTNVQAAISLLYLLGAVEYDLTTDTLLYTASPREEKE